MDFSIWSNDDYPPLNDTEKLVFEACVSDVLSDVDAVAMASTDCRLLGRLSSFVNLGDWSQIRSECRRDYELDGLIGILEIIRIDYLLDTDETNRAFELAIKSI
ncbi:hypothetical protein KC867_00610 [Candidatus Saccharibacteria bacterium]|nr:hypothetical protein [Candidatus Saccharibacteria bacterium]